MILSDKDIKTKLEKGEIKVNPMPDLAVALGTISIDLRLGYQFLIYRRTASPVIDVRNPSTFEGLTELVTKTKDDHFIVHPDEFILASTLEWVELPLNLAGRLEGKSSLGRMGIVIHSTAGKVDPGFKGTLTLEISNLGTLPVILYPETPVCQLVFEELSSPTSKGYSERPNSKYKNPTMPEQSKIAEDYEG